MPAQITHDLFDHEPPATVADVDDCSAAELTTLLDAAAAVADGESLLDPDAGGSATLAMLFEKPSTRTRVSFETAMTDLGGHAQFLGPDDLQLGAGEPLRDTARALSRYVDAVVARLFDHRDLETLATYADVPVINGLTDRAHPCQTLADLLTLRETVGLDADVAWVGDANNVCRSFGLGCALLGVDLTVAAPAGHGLDEEHLARADDLGTAPTTTTDPAAAVDGADAVYTDVWVSMGEEDEREAKLPAFETGGFRVDEALLSAAADDGVFMHCLPAHRGEEVTDAVLEGSRSVVWQQAENRLHAQTALLAWLLG